MRTTILVLLLSALAFGQEPIRFRGAYVGEPLADFLDCSSGKGKLLKEGYKTHGKLCGGGKGTIWKTKVRGFLYTMPEGEVFMFDESKLFRIMVLVANDDWEKVRYDITEKMGPPASEIPQVFQNAFGARWEYNQGFWVNGKTVVFAGVKVDSFGGVARPGLFSNQPVTRGIEVTITDADHAKLPSTRPNMMD